MFSILHASKRLITSSRCLLRKHQVSSTSITAVTSRTPSMPRRQPRFFSSSSTKTTTSETAAKPNMSLWNNESSFFNKKRILNLNISEMAGNFSSILVLGAYTMTDMFSLRVVSLAATSLSLIFQYYRKVPLWIPFRWNFVLLFINATMVTKLHLERQRAESMTADMEELFEKGQFSCRGFSRVEFLRLYDLAEVVTLPPDQVMVREGQAKESLHFLLDGTVRINKRGKTVARLGKYKFIGEVSLLGRMVQDINTGASADVIVDCKAPATFLKWDFDKLIPYIQGDREVFNALAAYLNYDLTAKLLRDGVVTTSSS
jgi:CRP-like cAMP-binding protein